MPQLDFYAFMPVVSWLIVILFIFYNILLASGLSRIFKILLYRKKTLEFYLNLKEILEKEIYFISKINYKVLTNYTKIYKFSVQTSNTIIEKRLDIEKEFLIKENTLVKNWLDAKPVCLPTFTRESLVMLIKKV